MTQHVIGVVIDEAHALIEIALNIRQVDQRSADLAGIDDGPDGMIDDVIDFPGAPARDLT